VEGLPQKRQRDSLESNEIEKIIKNEALHERSMTENDVGSDQFSDIQTQSLKPSTREIRALQQIEEKHEKSSSNYEDDKWDSEDSSAKKTLTASQPVGLSQTGLPPTKTGKPSKLQEMIDRKDSPVKPGFMEESNRSIDFDLSVGQSVGQSHGLKLMNKHLGQEDNDFLESKDFDVSQSGFDHSLGSAFQTKKQPQKE